MRAYHHVSIVVICACGGGDHTNDATGALISGTAHVVHGPMVPVMFAAAPAGALTDGKWYVTPDKVYVKLDRINFAGQGGGGTGADLADCTLTFDKSTPTLSTLLDCPFMIAPGTYTGMTVFVDGTFQVQLSDAVNGIYTDSGSPSGLSTTAPTGGASLVPYTRPLGMSGVAQLFATPLVVGDDASTVSLAIVLDAIQTLHLSVTNGGTTLTFEDLNQFPVYVLPTLDVPGIARYLTTASTANSYNDSLVLANILRVYYASGPSGQPTYAFTEQTAGNINGCALPAPAYPSDQRTSSLGGWLGRDSTGTTCWVSSRDNFATYEAYFTLPDVSTVGATSTLSCQHTTTPTPPSSGSTYASGCPAISATATAQMMLVAQ